MAVIPAGISNKPLYQGIIDDIHEQISDRRLHPGDRILSIGQMADRYSVSPITAKRAVAELQSLGLVRSVQGKGTFVTGVANTAADTPSLDTPLKTVTLMTNNLDARGHRGFFAAIWEAIESECERRDLEFRVQVIPDGGRGFHVDLSFKPDPADGLVFLAPSYPYTVLHLIQDRTIPVVMVDSILSFAHCVTTDNFGGMRSLIRHLRDLGHQRLAFAGRHPRSPNPTNENERAAAFQNLTDEYNLQGTIAAADDTDALIAMVKKKNGPTAVMFSQDDPAKWFIKAAKKTNIRVPQDISVTGFDGWRFAEGREDDLTTLFVDFAGIGNAAVAALVDLASNRAILPQWHRVAGQLQTGRSTAPPRKR